MKIPPELERTFSALPSNYFGGIELVFQAGSLVLLKQTTTTKFTATNGTPGSHANAK
jgi:hypothetical protein